MDELIKDIEDLGKGKSWNSPKHDAFEQKYKKTFMKTLGSLSDAEKAKLDDVLYAAIRSGSRDVMETIANPIFNKRKLIDWKNRPDLIDRMIDILVEILADRNEAASGHEFSSFVSKLLDTLKGHQLLEKHSNKLFEVIREAFKSFEQPESPMHSTASSVISVFPWLDLSDFVVETVKLLKDAVKLNPDTPEGSDAFRNAEHVFTMMFPFQSGKNVHLLALNDVTELFNFCAQQDFQCSEDPSKKNICYKLLQTIMQGFLSSGHTLPELVRPMMADIRDLWDCGDEKLRESANSIMGAMGDQKDLVGDATSVLLEQFLNGKQPNITGKLVEMYKNQPEEFHPLLPKFLQLIKNGNVYKMLIVQLLTEVAKKAPEELPNDAVQTIVEFLNDTTGIYMAIMFLDAVAIRQPESVIPFDDKMIAAMSFTEHAPMMVAGVLAKLGIDEDHQRKYLRVLADAVQEVNGPQQIVIINSMRTIGASCLSIFAEYKELFETLRKRPELIIFCQLALDMIEGRSLEKVTSEVSEQREDITKLDNRVGSTEENVENLSREVDQNKVDMTQVKGNVAKQGQQLDGLQTVVDETVDKVEELDHKTLSHAPAWSVDVAKMLNAKADHDWRLLASRLGYSTEDIRNWATQPNPCLSMFDEWFATHKTREATYGILKTLVEMDRTDASVIVDKALKSVEHIVEDDEEEPAQPPPVFLSYQWAHQPEVKLLKRHLGMAGYSSWMDIGQMGGGDKLFAKIDSGIRAAKVIVCCVTERYADSPNCNREVNLAVTLGKPIIPLLVEKMSWPPPGSMGPIFGEYIFVRFFQRPDEKTGDDRYWAPDKFTELLFQLRYNIAPDNTLIVKDSPYRNWWQPPEEVIVIKPKAKTTAGLPSVEEPDTKKYALSPDIFISYQWDKQPQIKVLYRRLSQLGYTCWLDIMQMGGGDSLYDKIDRGIRGCKVIVSCVTTKYALSANCRREVSLADAIKKPIIPLLLEKSSWPPEGPMGMVFTQLLYIDFCKPSEDIQMEWNCPQFDQLLERMSKALPATSVGEAPSRPSETPLKQPAKYPITESKKTEKQETKNGAAAKPATLLKPSTRPKPESVPKPEAGERKETALKPEVRLKPLTPGKPGAPLKPAKPGKSSAK